MDKLPVYEMVIDEAPESDVEVSFVALVDKPAIEKNFMAFNSLRIEFAADEERQIISGPAMVADTLIYRRDANGEYNVFFSKNTIAEIALKFFKKDYQKNLNLFHDPALSLQGVTIFESFVSDKARGIQPMKGYEDLPDGTWFISAKVENPEVWAKIKSGEVKGFSVEGIFSYMKKPQIMNEQIAEILSATYNKDGHLDKSTFMSAVKDMIETFKKTFFNGTPMIPVSTVPAPAPAPAPVQALETDYQLKDGTPVSISDLNVGGVVMIAGVPAPTGDHELADGTKITVGEGGLITAVVPVAAAPEPMAAPALQMEQVNDAIATAVKQFADQLAKADDRIKKQEQTIKGLFDIVEKLAEVPTANPVVPAKTGFNTQKQQSVEDRRAFLANALKNLKTA